MVKSCQSHRIKRTHNHTVPFFALTIHNNIGYTCWQCWSIQTPTLTQQQNIRMEQPGTLNVFRMPFKSDMPCGFCCRWIQRTYVSVSHSSTHAHSHSLSHNKWSQSVCRCRPFNRIAHRIWLYDVIHLSCEMFVAPDLCLKFCLFFLVNHVLTCIVCACVCAITETTKMAKSHRIFSENGSKDVLLRWIWIA